MATNGNNKIEKLITVDELSELIGMRPFTIRMKCRQRKIPCYKVEGMYKFRMSEIEKNKGKSRGQIFTGCPRMWPVNKNKRQRKLCVN